MIGVSTIEKPMLCIMEHMENGDLKNYFQNLDRIESVFEESIQNDLITLALHSAFRSALN